MVWENNNLNEVLIGLKTTFSKVFSEVDKSHVLNGEWVVILYCG